MFLLLSFNQFILIFSCQRENLVLIGLAILHNQQMTHPLQQIFVFVFLAHTSIVYFEIKLFPVSNKFLTFSIIAKQWGVVTKRWETYLKIKLLCFSWQIWKWHICWWSLVTLRTNDIIPSLIFYKCLHDRPSGGWDFDNTCMLHCHHTSPN